MAEKKQGKKEGASFEFGGKGTSAAEAAILPIIQKRLNTLIGKSSGYLDELPAPVQNRIKVLKQLHAKKVDIDREFKKELKALHEKFDKLLDPLYTRRRDIVQGISEPSEEELKQALTADPKETKEEKSNEKSEEKKDTKAQEEDVKGIPGFWMEALKHHDEFAEMITKKDEAALKHLIDLRWKHISDPENKWSVGSFSLEFEFAENPYFTNKVLTKTFYLTENEQFEETMFDHLEASTIDWKPGKNLTVKMVQQQVGGGKRGGRKGGRGRGKPQGQGKTVMVEQPADSFFNYFSANVTIGLEDEELEEEDLQGLYENEYELGLIVKEQLIASAVLWFTGEIQEPYEDSDGAEEGDEGEYDSAEDPDFEVDPNAPAPAEGQKPECAQQ